MGSTSHPILILRSLKKSPRGFLSRFITEPEIFTACILPQFAFGGWLAFLVVYIPLELTLFMLARCSIFYYYYPSACGAGLMVERVAASKGVRGELRVPRANERQIIRIDWYREH